MNFTATPPYQWIASVYYRPRGHFISAQPKISPAGIFEYSSRALSLVWSTNKTLSITLAVLTLAAGALPAGVAYVGAQIVDAVIHAADLHRRTGTTFLTDVVRYVALEAVLVAATAMAQRGISLAQSLLRAQLGQRVNVMILEKALTLDLTQFEDSDAMASPRNSALTGESFAVPGTGVIFLGAAGIKPNGGLNGLRLGIGIEIVVIDVVLN